MPQRRPRLYRTVGGARYASQRAIQPSSLSFDLTVVDTLLSVSKVLLEKLSEEGLEIPQAHVRLDVARDYMPYVIALEN